jgi:hypothetical protein
MRSKSAIAFAVVAVSLTLTQLRQPSQNSVTIPLDITSYGGIFLQARINHSQPLWFYLDSGSTSGFVIAAKKATALGLRPQSLESRAGGAGPNTYEVSQASGLTIALEQRAFADQSAAVMSLEVVEQQLGRSVDGLVGLDLFLKHVVEIDYSGKKLRLYDPQTYVYSGTGESISLTLLDGHFLVPATIGIADRELTGQFLVDTGGCMMTTILTTPFAYKNHLPVPSQKTILDQSVAGIGGDTRLLVGRASNFKIGSSVLPSPLIYISQDQGGALASSAYQGLIGTEVLRRFKVIFDYPRRRLIVERNVHFEEPFEYDMSGLSVRAYGAAFKIFKIYQVLEESPAGRAGLRVGDLIEDIDGVPASRLTLEQIHQRMKVPGHEYKLTIKRDGATRLVMIKTSKLI